MKPTSRFYNRAVALNAHTIIFNSTLVTKRFSYPLPRTAIAFVLDTPLV
jgi:hypothetical protein